MTDRKKITIIIVDDDEGMLMLNSRRLKKDITDYDLEIHTTVSPPEALSLIEEKFPDVVILDWFMPVCDGPDLVVAARKTPGGAAAAYVLISGLDCSSPKLESARSMGLAAILEKSTGLVSLPSVVRRIVMREPVLEGCAIGSNAERIAPVDMAALHSMIGGDTDLIAEIFELFIGEVPARLGFLKQAVETEDSTAVERVAHSIKSAATGVYATRLRLLCSETEKAAASDTAALPLQIISAIELEIKAVIHFMKDYLKHNPH